MPGYYGFIYVTLCAAANGLTTGTYLGTVTITVESATLTVPVALNVGDSPILDIAPATIDITLPNTGKTSFDQWLVPNTGGADAGNLVAASSTTDSVPGMPGYYGFIYVTLGAAANGLTTGTYLGTVTITVESATLTVPVALNVGDSPILDIAPATIDITLPNTGKTSFDQWLVPNTGGADAGNLVAASSTANGLAWLSEYVVQLNTGASPGLYVPVAHIDAAGLAPGLHRGTITFTNRTNVQAVAVVLTVSGDNLLPSTTGLVFTSATGEDAVQTFTVDSAVEPGGFDIAATTADGFAWLEVDPKHAVTPATVTVTVHPVLAGAGTHAGLITLTRPNSLVVPVSLPVALEVGPIDPSITSVVNAASFRSGPVSPGELVTILGTHIGPTQGVSAAPNASGRLDPVLSGTRVLFDDVAVPLIYTSATQVSAIVPYELAGRMNTSLRVDYNERRSITVPLAVSAASPGLFGGLLNQDGSVNSPQNGAEPGSILTLYATGGGQTDPPSLTGGITPVDSPPRQVLPVRVLIDGRDVDVTYSGGAPGAPNGVVQVNARIPADLPRSTYASATIQFSNNTSPPIRVWVK